jgi:CBS-domain-containing membrane protein
MQTRDIMTSPVVTVTPDTALKDAAATLVEHGINAAPVVTEDRRLLGIVSEADLLGPDAPQHPGAGGGRSPDRRRPRTVQEVMTPAVYTIPEDADAAAAGRLLRRHGLKSIPVVTNGLVVGIVARRDLLRLVARSDQEIHHDLQRRLQEEVAALQRLGIDVSDGMVTFRGAVGSPARELARVLANAVPGVVEVRWEPPS